MSVRDKKEVLMYSGFMFDGEYKYAFQYSNRGARDTVGLFMKFISTVATAPLEIVKRINEERGKKDEGLKSRENQLYRIKRKAVNLANEGLLKISKKEGELEYKLTKKGERVLQVILMADRIQNTKGRRWDGYWRVVVFDFKEQRADERTRFRRHLINLGFEMIQKSVWVYPFECFDYLRLIAGEADFVNDLRLIKAKEIFSEKDILKKFDLVRF